MIEIFITTIHNSYIYIYLNTNNLNDQNTMVPKDCGLEKKKTINIFLVQPKNKP